MRKLLILAAAGLGLAISAPIAGAQSIQFGPDGVRVDPGIRGPGYDPRYDGRIEERRVIPQRDFISRSEARRIARSQGVVEIDEIYRDGRRYEVEGADRRGRDISVSIDARTGDVIRVVRVRS